MAVPGKLQLDGRASHNNTSLIEEEAAYEGMTKQEG